MSDKRRAKLAFGVLSTLAVSMVAAAVIIAIAAGDDGELSAAWALAFLALLVGFVLAVLLIVELRQSEPTKPAVSINLWLWPLLILGWGTFLGTLLALTVDRPGFWNAFAFGFTLGVINMSFGFVANTVPKALHRFVKRP
ncbi:MAG: hypothetical protein ACRDKU_04000 [Gaiellaceae bacterium]